MFPKYQRIVKKKEIEKALKTPFRTGFDYGQILLFPRKNQVLKTNPKKIFPNKVSKGEINDKINQMNPDNLQNIEQKENIKTQNSRFEIDEINCKINSEKNEKAEKNEINDKNISLNLTQNFVQKSQNNSEIQVKNLEKFENQNEKLTKLPSKKLEKTNKETNKFRVLCIVSKKIHKKANQRNKIRRRFVSIFQDLDYQKRLPPDLDLTIIIRTKDILTAKFEDYQKIVPKVAAFYQKLTFQGKIPK